MDLFAGFSDDQLALLGCFGALSLCGVLLMLSSFVGRSRRQSAQKDGLRLHAVEISERTSLPQDVPASTQTRRKAA